MVYTFELIKHANVHYREAVSLLARCELTTMLHGFSVNCPVQEEILGVSRFLTFECRELSDPDLQILSRHSSLSLMAEKQENGLLRVLPVQPCFSLPEELPEILKYKGKTSATFTRMMINTAAALTPSFSTKEPILFFDPLCGKGTWCFCALTLGMVAFGLDTDGKAIREATDYFSRFLKLNRIKHSLTRRSETFGKQALPVTNFTFATNRELYQAGKAGQLTLAEGDTSLSPALFRRQKAQLIVADLPYGVQHAPQASSGHESLERFLRRALPVWKSVLRPGGAMALSFNTLTLSAATVRDAMRLSGCGPWRMNFIRTFATKLNTRL